MVTLVAARRRDSLLPTLRAATAGAHDLLWCVAFVRDAGVHLLARELRLVSGLKRVLATGVFGGAGSEAGLRYLTDLGVQVRVLNLGGGHYHPKMYLFDNGGSRQAIVGSANLTGGLINNLEAAIHIDPRSPDALADVWALGEELWEDSSAVAWRPTLGMTASESMTEALLEALLVSVPEGSIVATLAEHRPNVVTALRPDAIWVETEKTRQRGTGPQPIPGWMLQLAYDRLRSHGSLTNRELLRELRVHRSSFVCATLALLPDVEVVSRSPISLRWRPLM